MGEDLPITGVCIVADCNRCPPNFTLLDKTYGSIQEDADLWKDRYWGRKITRYLCVERGYSAQDKNVLVDVAIINEKDPVPPGFTVIDPTYDTHEKAVKKKILCVRWMEKTLTNDAITEIVLLGRNYRKPPPTYTLVGELNGLSVCYKVGRLAQPVKNQMHVTPNSINNHHLNAINVSNLGSSLPYPIMPNTSAPLPPIRPSGGGESSSSVPVNATALLGVPWQLNSKLQSLTELKDITIPQIRYKSLYDVEKEYDYDFRMERSVMATK